MRNSLFFFVLTGIFLFQAFTVRAEAGDRDRLLKQLRSAASDTAKVRLYGELYEACKDFDKVRALKSLDDMYRLAVRTGYRKGLEQAAGLKGVHFYTEQQPDSALVYFHRQLAFLSRGQLREKARVYCNIGMVYNTMGKPEKALAYFSRTLAICRKTDCGYTYCAVLNNLGMTVYTLGDKRKSTAYFEEAYACAVESGETADLPNIVNNLASVYAATGVRNPDKLFLDLLQDRRYSFPDDVKATVYMNLGAYYFRNGQPEPAENYFRTADSIFRSAGHTNPEILHSLGSIRLERKDPTGALAYFLQVREQFPQYNQMGSLYRDMANASYSQGDHAAARDYYEQGLIYADSANRAAVSGALKEAQQNLDFLRKEAEIHELTFKAKIRANNEQRRSIVGASVIVVLLLLAVIAVLFFRKERSRRKMNELLLSRKNEKIREFGEKIASRNKTIGEIERKFTEYRDKHDMQEQLKADIIDTLLLDGDNETFAHYFEDQHKGFYEALKKHAPALTNNDLRLCSLTRLRLSLKETADILNLSVDAVKSGRYRVRKKLGLETDESLSDFLNSLKDA